MGTIMKPTVGNIIRLWFGADTPIRQYKVKLNPELWAACERVSQDFVPPSGILLKENYRKSDKTSFARAVLEELDQVDEEAEEHVGLAH
ncbi:hypothetical protein GCM10028806_42340 [Spirosoma terrae]|uniref:Uncharacterized protein n=2 Tax=Spirosoma terrae TaxID=1968276 RepID=A0A6L9L197_9BACT|nr:hypothetical protein [Spirosoma terrae]